MENHENNDQQFEVLYGPAAEYSEHKRGEVVKFADEESAQELTGTIEWIYNPAPTYDGGKPGPLTYVVSVPGSPSPYFVYPEDIIEDTPE